MQTTDFCFGIVLTVTLIAVVSTSCARLVTCPCGNITKAVYYSHCVNETSEEEHTCERWVNCKTCEANTTHCLTCHPGHSGPTCAKDAVKINKTSLHEALFGSCPALKSLASGNTVCLDRTSHRECTASCISGFYFERLKNVNLITLKCHEKTWTPLQQFPPCRPGPRCTLRVRGNGYFHCTSDADGAHCDVTCDGNFQGQYHCNLRQWRPSLPQCVVPAEEKAIALCADPGKPDDMVRKNADGTAADISRSFEEGESVRFFCKEKVKLQGHRFITCRSDGTWSGDVPQCTNITSSELISIHSGATVQFRAAVWLNVMMWIVIFLSMKVLYIL